MNQGLVAGARCPLDFFFESAFVVNNTNPMVPFERSPEPCRSRTHAHAAPHRAPARCPAQAGKR